MTDREKGLIAWFVYNPVAANLLMIFILVAGLFSFTNIEKKTLPDFMSNIISVSVIMSGTGPKDIEQSIILKIEQAIKNIRHIKQVRSIASDGLARVEVEIETGEDQFLLLDEIKLAVDAISSFPAKAERPVISRMEFRTQVLWLSISGELERRSLKTLAHEIRDELLQKNVIEDIRLVGDLDYEIAIEVDENTLMEYNIDFSIVADAVRNRSLNQTSGSVQSKQGKILLRTQGQAYTADDFSRLVLMNKADGSQLLLSDVATISDGFAESSVYARFNGKPSLNIQIMSSQNASDTEVAKVVAKYISEKQKSLPIGVELTGWADISNYLKDRLSMMLDNLLLGGTLVFIVLTLFLRLRIALWVVVGIPISFFGAVWLMGLAAVDVSINLISLFAFILVLGVVVDDAIIIGESIFHQIKEYGHNTNQVIRGTKIVAAPATFGVLTTVAAFAPLLFLEGQLRPFFATVSIVVIFCLFFSLIESKLILPAHLATTKLSEKSKKKARFYQLQLRFQSFLESFITGIYQPFLIKMLNNRVMSLTSFVAILVITIGLMGSGMIRYEFYPNVPSDYIRVTVEMSESSSYEKRDRLLELLQDKLEQTASEFQTGLNTDEDLVDQVLVYTTDDTNAQIIVEMNRHFRHQAGTIEIANRWRQLVGPLTDIKQLRFVGSTNTGGGSPIDFQLISDDQVQLQQFALAMTQKLNTFNGVFDVRSDSSFGRRELNIELKPQAETYQLTRKDIARQIRQAFFGEEAQRIQRGQDEVKVMLRYPLQERRSINDLDQMWLLTKSGDRIPLNEVAIVTPSTTFSRINRVDGKQTIRIMADINNSQVQSRQINAEIENSILPPLLDQYKDVEFQLGGISKDQEASLRNIASLVFLSIFLIYTLLAIPLKSYLKPLLIMLVIPFGVTGAVIGHLLMGKAMSMMSLLGVIALSGVVVNDSLILVDYANRLKNRGRKLVEAVVEAGTRRFKAIVLTSLTTFVGLLPIMTESSLQAQFVIPMAISLAFGVLFATVISLLLVPVLLSFTET